MMRFKVLGAAALLLFSLAPTQAHAGTWRTCWRAGAMNVPTIPGQFGTQSGVVPTRVTGSNGNPYVELQSSDDPDLTMDFSIPDFLSSTSWSWQAWGKINSTTPTNNVCLSGYIQVSTSGQNWEANAPVSSGSTVAAIHPVGTANTVVGNAIAFSGGTFVNQNGGATCATVGTCSGFPARLRVLRITTGCSNNDSAAFDLQQVCIYGTTP